MTDTAGGGITGPDVVIPVPGTRGAIATTVLVSVRDQQWIDELRFGPITARRIDAAMVTRPDRR